MTPERWQQIEKVLQAVLDRAPEQRAAYLQEVCTGDDELQAEASSLVSAYDEAADFIETPAIAQDARVLLSDQSHTIAGQEIGPYKILERLGGGGMGEVHLAEDTRLNRQVALKILPAYFVSDDARLRRFQTEARAASALNHPNILTIHEVGDLDGVYFIATEFIDGQTIRELIANDELSLADVLDISAQVASALVVAHAAGIVHRDIKPENIMRRRDGIVKILDFGIAKLLEPASVDSSLTTRSQTETGVVLGTVGYMSPEQARGLAVDERTDLWSLGVVLYEMLAYRAPFNGATRMDTMVAILEREPAPLFRLDNSTALQRLEKVAARALRKERSERYQTAAELHADLTSIKQHVDSSNTADQNVLNAMRGDAGVTDNRTSAIPLRTSTMPLAVTGERNGYRRYGLMLMSFIALAALITAIFLYPSIRARRSVAGAPPPVTVATDKLYAEMDPAEQLRFIDDQEQRISAMMGERPVRLNDEALGAIKAQVDRTLRRHDKTSRKPGVEDLPTVYARAPPLIPVIARAFAARKIPIVLGIYLPMVESAYRPCVVSAFGAKGLFQFLPITAKQYGVTSDEMCDVEKMAPVAAHYIADRMAELGDDSQSMTLVLLSYNRGPDGVRDALRLLRETDSNYERNFWTLYANRDKLDDGFRNESAYYVPAFFAAAIIGENPRNFELPMPPLSTLIENH